MGLLGVDSLRVVGFWGKLRIISFFVFLGVIIFFIRGGVIGYLVLIIRVFRVGG